MLGSICDPRGVLRSGALIALVLAAGAATGCVGVGGAPQPTAQYDVTNWDYRNQRGSKLVTAHYEIFTTLRDPNLVSTLPELMETAFARYQERVPSAREPGGRMQVYLFASRADWGDFTRRFTGPRASVFLQVRNGGYSERGVSVIEYTRHQTTFPLMTHEGFHQYLYHYVNDQIPAWLNEGLAVLYEGQRWIGAGTPVFDSWYNPARQNALAEAVVADKLFPLGELLDTHAGNIISRSSRTVGTYYAQLWALMLFLEEGENGKYAPKFRKLLHALGTSDVEQYARASFIWSPKTKYSFGEALFRAFIDEDVDKLEMEFRKFLREKFITKR